MKCLFVAHAVHSKSQSWYVSPDPNSTVFGEMEAMFAANVRTIFNVDIASQIKFYGRARTERPHLCLSAKHHPGSSHEQEDLDCVSEVSVGVATNLLVGHGNVKQCLP
jgi:hypothetical protein